MRIEQQVPYQLIIGCSSWVGNFERALIGYSLGILDEVQMGINHSLRQRELFWEEEFNKDKPIDYYDDYELKDEYLFETYQEVDDWEQMTFYNVGKSTSNNSHSCINIQLVKPLNDYWEEIVVRRIKEFFVERPCRYSYDTQLLEFFLVDETGTIIKDYLE